MSSNVSMFGFPSERRVPRTEDDDINLLLNWFFQDTVRLEMMYDLRKSSRRRNFISLRLVDYFVVNYSKSKRVMYWVRPNGTIYPYDDEHPHAPIADAKWFNVHESYKMNCKDYTKQGFDTFCRQGNQDLFQVPFKRPVRGTLILETNLRQLRFFAWAIKNGVLNYVQAHEKEITDDMVWTLKHTERPALRPTDTVTHKKRKLKKCNSFVQPMQAQSNVGFKRSRCT
jgi:hypothetical protein